MKFIKILTVFCALTYALVAHAGQSQPAEVAVDLTNLTASGDMLSARIDRDDDVFIGCGIRVFDDGAGGTFEFGFCQAEDNEGERAFCNTDSPGLLGAMKATSDYSFVTFSWDADGICTRIGFSTQSFYLPNRRRGRR